MKLLMAFLASILILSSCSSLNKVVDEGKYRWTEVSDTLARDYRARYENSPAFRSHFKKGMFIPMAVIDAIRTSEGLTGVMIYYGRSPEYNSPVFLVYGSRHVLGYKRSDVFADKVYMVYYPCPSICD